MPAHPFRIAGSAALVSHNTPLFDGEGRDYNTSLSFSDDFICRLFFRHPSLISLEIHLGFPREIALTDEKIARQLTIRGLFFRHPSLISLEIHLGFLREIALTDEKIARQLTIC
jgi:hypothetical protein